MRRRLGAIVGLGIVVLAFGLLWAAPTGDVRELQDLRGRSDRIRMTGPHHPPELVPPRAPGPGLTT